MTRTHLHPIRADDPHSTGVVLMAFLPISRGMFPDSPPSPSPNGLRAIPRRSLMPQPSQPTPSFPGYRAILEAGLDSVGGGWGGVARVFKAEHLPSGDVRAIKLLRPRFAAQPTWVERFYQEAELLADCSHPNALRTFPEEGSRLSGEHLNAPNPNRWEK
jgi:hypothetical protein